MGNQEFVILVTFKGAELVAREQKMGETLLTKYSFVPFECQSM